MQSFADVPVTSDGVETASFLDASDGLVNMFGKYRNTLTGRTWKPIPPKRPPWRRRVFLCPGRFANQHQGASPSCLSDRPSMAVPVNILPMRPEQGVRSCHASHHQASTTLEMLVTSESQEGTRQSTACLVRLMRYVRLRVIVFCEPPSELSFCTRAQWSPVHLSSAGKHASRSHF